MIPYAQAFRNENICILKLANKLLKVSEKKISFNNISSEHASSV